MKKIFLTAVVALVSMCCQAQDVVDTISAQAADSVQTLRFGYLSYDSILKAMPEYVGVQEKIKALRQAYADELKRVEDEFNQKYEAFLDGQKDFPRTILLKRQTELQELMERNVQFKRQGIADIKSAEAQAMAPLRARLNEVIAIVAREYRLALVVNTDSNACPFIEPVMAMDINQLVIDTINDVEESEKK